MKELLNSFPALAITTNSVNATALDTAATQGHVDIVNLLLETDASLARIARNNGKTALHSAARMGHVEVVKALLNKDPSIGWRTDKKGQTALHMAVKAQNIEIVLELLRPNVSVINTGDNKGNRPLHVATRKGNINVSPRNFPNLFYHLCSLYNLQLDFHVQYEQREVIGKREKKKCSLMTAVSSFSFIIICKLWIQCILRFRLEQRRKSMKSSQEI